MKDKRFYHLRLNIYVGDSDQTSVATYDNIANKDEVFFWINIYKIFKSINSYPKKNCFGNSSISKYSEVLCHEILSVFIEYYNKNETRAFIKNIIGEEISYPDITFVKMFLEEELSHMVDYEYECFWAFSSFEVNYSSSEILSCTKDFLS